MVNTYSSTWFNHFLTPLTSAQTAHELAFLTRCLPQPDFKRVLDLYCGTGRHARLLAEEGYEVIGLDRDPVALARARAKTPRARYLEGDMRNLEPVPDGLDAIINLWQSFGYFDDATNAAILKQIRGKLRPKGRLVLDIYHCGFFEQHQGVRHFDKGGLHVSEAKRMEGRRLHVKLDYGPGRASDGFEWQLYTPEEIRALAEQMGFCCVLVCARFDETTPPSAEQPRMQLVLEKAS